MLKKPKQTNPELFVKGTESSQRENKVYAQWWKPGAVSQLKGSPIH